MRALAGVVFSSLRRQSATRVSSLAVLPFTDLSSPPEQERFADGITEELTTVLAQLKTVRVISRTSAMRLKGTKLPLRDIGRELGVDAVVEGSVQRSGNRVRVSAQLVQVTTERHLWAETYERDVRDVLQVRSEVAQDIASRVRNEIAPGEATRPAQSGISPEAFDAYLTGTRLASRGGKQGFGASIGYFEKAIRLEPSFAPAWAALAESHAVLAFKADERGDHFARAQDAAIKAFELDPTLPEAQIATADLLFYWDWDWSQCGGRLREAAENYPNSAQAQLHYGECLFILGRHDDALRYLENARRVDPLSVPILMDLGHLLVVMGRHGEAIQVALKARDLRPDNPAVHDLLFWAYERAGSDSDAVMAWVDGRRLAGDVSDAELQAQEQAYRSGGWEAFERRTRRSLRPKLNNLLAKEKQGAVKPLVLAEYCAWAGESDLAFHYLEQGYRERSPGLVWIKYSLAWLPLHGDPRFHELVRRMGLPD